MFASSGFRQALREAAPTLSKRYFSTSQTCRAFHHRPSPITPLENLSFRRASNIPTKRIYRQQTSPTRSFRTTSRILETLSATSPAIKPSQSSFPSTSSNTVAYWLLASAASVFGIVVFGGLTRLTESGLSITEWRPVTGSLPPMSDADWASEYEKYKRSPEFLVLNSKMTLEEFKGIYWMEWIHRIWGRVVGISFLLPMAWFIARRRMSKDMVVKTTGIAGLIGFQGFLGWWMVKSGLKDDFLKPDKKPGRDVPRVSQYRLAAHLGTAFVAYLSMLWCGLDILRTNALLKTSTTPTPTPTATLYALRNPALRPFKLAITALLGLTFTTAMSGALVAGLDAGLIYNEFPSMGLGLTPPKSELFDPFYSHDPSGQHKDLIWRNMLENPSLVQLDHRILATTTFTAVHALWAWVKFSPTLRAFLPRSAVRGVHGVVGFVWLQVILGISTLIYMVPIPLASAHQAGALALLSWVTVLGSRVWFPRAAAEVLKRRAVAGAGVKAKYEFPAIEKVKPNYGSESRAAGALQASVGLGAAVVAASGTLVAAGKIEEGRQERRQVRWREEQMEFLRWQARSRVSSR